MRIERKEGKTYYISDDEIYYTDKWDCIQHENWIKEDDRRINLQERWNKLINSLPIKSGECPVYQEASTDYKYTYVTIKNKKELEKLQREMKNPGFTIVPVRLFINEKGLAKLVVALAKGKKEYDKRESIKEKDDRRDMARMFKR